LQLADGSVIDESRDVMLWALGKADPHKWLGWYHKDKEGVLRQLDALDSDFKHHLDRYKYATRYDDVDEAQHRDAGAVFLQDWNRLLGEQAALSGEALGLLDFATLPFVRQFRIADSDWFDAQDWPHLHRWLQDFLHSDAFQAVMEKYKPWLETGDDIAF